MFLCIILYASIYIYIYIYIYIICQLLLTFLTKVTRWSRSTSNFYALIGEFMQKICAASWNLFTLTAEADRVLCQLVMFLTVFLHWMYKMKFSCYQESSFIRLSKSEIWFRMVSFSFSPCLMRKYLKIFSASRMVSLSNYFIWCSFFISNLMKSSVVYGAIWFNARL